MPSPDPSTTAPRRELTLLDTVCITVGIIIGATIYESSPEVARNVAGPAWLIAAWLLGGAISLAGALCYAELATRYPRDGGEYVFLTHAFGRRMGLLFAWVAFWVVRPGSIGAVAYIFARYAQDLWPLGSYGFMTYGLGSVVILTFINILGVHQSKWTQNLLTITKVLGLLGVVVAGLLSASQPPTAMTTSAPVKVLETDPDGFPLAMILVLFAFGGWSDMAYVAAEVAEPRKNILRALVLGTLAVTLAYLLINLIALHALGFGAFQQSKVFAADVVRSSMGEAGGVFISTLVCISCLGGVHGMIFTGARIFYAVGEDHRLFAWLGRWHPRFETPVRALILQAVITLALMIGFGLYEDGFNRLIVFAGPPFWFFLMLTGIALFVIRVRERNGRQLAASSDNESTSPAHYRVALYPITPLLFCLACAYMVYSSTRYAIGEGHAEGWWAIGAAIAGILIVIPARSARVTRS